MRILKIVHTADLHLGSYFSSTPEIAANRKLEQLENLREIVNSCTKASASVLLIAGDLFDSLRCDRQLLNEVQSILGGSGVRVFIAPGNHDPATPDSAYFAEGWPENVHIFKGGLEGVEITEGDVKACIWGLGFRHSVEAECLLPSFTPKDGMINILLMHSELVPGDSAESRYNPVTFRRLQSLGVDYCALGHAHKPSVTASGEFVVCSCGCPCGRGFDEPGEHGVYAGYVGRGFSHMEFTPLPGRRYYTEKIDVSGCEATDAFCAAIKDFLSKNVGEGWSEHIYDITLLGALAKGIMPDSQAIAKRLMDELHYARVTDMTTTELDLDALMKDTGLRGAFVRTIVSRMEKDEAGRARYERALLYGLRAFDGEVRINEDH